MTSLEDREKRLIEARATVAIARSLLAEVDAWYDRARSLVMPPSRKRHRAQRIAEAVERLQGKLFLESEVKRRFEYEDEDAKRKAEEDRRKADQLEREKADRELIQEAVIWLQTKGKVLGTDFTIADAVQTANHIAFDEELARIGANEQWHDFNGQNCDGPCNGWDGISRRCDCGNRRVSWEAGYGHSFKSPYVVAEAY